MCYVMYNHLCIITLNINIIVSSKYYIKLYVIKNVCVCVHY